MHCEMKVERDYGGERRQKGAGRKGRIYGMKVNVGNAEMSKNRAKGAGRARAVLSKHMHACESTCAHTEWCGLKHSSLK